MIKHIKSSFTLFIYKNSKRGKIIPIEDKSGKNYKQHKALENFMEKSNYHVEDAIVFSISNVEKEGKITYLPIYMSYLLKETPLNQLIVDSDISRL